MVRTGNQAFNVSGNSNVTFTDSVGGAKVIANKFTILQASTNPLTISGTADIYATQGKTISGHSAGAVNITGGNFLSYTGVNGAHINGYGIFQTGENDNPTKKIFTQL